MLVLLSELVGTDVENGVVTGGTGIVVVDVVSTICAVVVGDNVVVIVVVPGVVVLVLLSELVGTDVENGVVTGGTGIVVVDVVSTICAVVVATMSLLL